MKLFPFFLFSQSKLYLGTEELKPTRSALRKDRRWVNHSSEAEEALDEDHGKDGNARELPEKVDKFVEYINNYYFDGELDTGTKSYLKKGTNEDAAGASAQKADSGRPKRIYNGDDVRGASPRSRRPMLEL